MEVSPNPPLFVRDEFTHPDFEAAKDEARATLSGIELDFRMGEIYRKRIASIANPWRAVESAPTLAL